MTNGEKLNEALLLKAEAQLLQRRDFSVVALIEARKTSGISEAKLRRAKSRLDAVIIYRKSAGSALRKIHGMLKSDDAGVA